MSKTDLNSLLAASQKEAGTPVTEAQEESMPPVDDPVEAVESGASPSSNSASITPVIDSNQRIQEAMSKAFDLSVSRSDIVYMMEQRRLLKDEYKNDPEAINILNARFSSDIARLIAEGRIKPEDYEAMLLAQSDDERLVIALIDAINIAFRSDKQDFEAKNEQNRLLAEKKQAENEQYKESHPAYGRAGLFSWLSSPLGKTSKTSAVQSERVFMNENIKRAHEIANRFKNEMYLQSLKNDIEVQGYVQKMNGIQREANQNKQDIQQSAYGLMKRFYSIHKDFDSFDEDKKEPFLTNYLQGIGLNSDAIESLVESLDELKKDKPAMFDALGEGFARFFENFKSLFNRNEASMTP